MKLKKKNSLSFRLLMGILAFLLPVNLLLTGYAFYASWSIQTQASNNYSDYITLAGKQIDHTLTDIRTFISNTFYINDYFIQMCHSNDVNTRYLAATQITNSAYDYINLFETPMLFFVTTKGLSIPVASTYSTKNHSLQSRIAISEFIHSLPEKGDTLTAGEYISMELGGEYFLIFFLQKNGNFIGSIIQLSPMLEALDFNDSGVLNISFTDHEKVLAKISSAEALSGDAIHIFSNLETAPIRLMINVSKSHVLGHLKPLQIFSLVIWVVSFLSVVAYFIFIQHQINRPLKRLSKTIADIQNGNLNQEIQVSSVAEEIRDVYRTFNNFMSHITDLKMLAYEEKLAKQQTEMQYLRLQLRPHFFLNSLKSIYALAQRGQMTNIQDYVLCLSNHYRFLIYDTQEMIPLKEELAHTRNYIQLQRIGFDLSIQCHTQIEPALLEMKVPTLIFQTFVENSIKYATISQQELQINIHAKISQICGQKYGSFSIYDNGPGFSKKMLKESTENEAEFYNHHKGLGNLYRRLSYIYAANIQFYFYNLPSGGAAVEIMIPLSDTHNEGDVFQ